MGFFRGMRYPDKKPPLVFGCNLGSKACFSYLISLRALIPLNLEVSDKIESAEAQFPYLLKLCIQVSI